VAEEEEEPVLSTDDALKLLIHVAIIAEPMSGIPTRVENDPMFTVFHRAVPPTLGQ
jgi:hypothetical protein